MRALVLDSEAISRLARDRARRAELRTVHAFLTAAVAARSPVRAPAAVLAEQYRGRGHDQTVDAMLSRHGGAIKIVDTDRDLARTIGHLLARHGRGAADHVDAAVVGTAVRLGGAIIMTSDEDDIGALADGLPGVAVETLR
jgi:PIN domain nuclease of toxin-antitoxin system